MINYSNFDLFNEDSIPKKLNIVIDDTTLTNSDLHYEECELTESICSESNLTFGSCESNMIKFKTSNISESFVGKEMTVSMTLNGDTENSFQLGVYKVYSEVPTSDRSAKDVTAYDKMYDIINSDVSDWYNTLLPNTDSTVTLKEFRDSFATHFGIEQEEITLPNDSMTIERTIEPSQLSGKDVIFAICEINGCFGHIGRDGKLKYVILDNTSEYTISNYKSATYEDFETQAISKLQIRQEENDIGVIVGDGDNCYIIQDNFLVYGKGTTELTSIANNIYSIISNVVYRPFDADVVGNPCIEVGDYISIPTKNKTINAFVLERTIKGIQSLTDTFSAQGEEKQPQTSNSIRQSIVQLKGKTNVLERTVEETKSTITNVEQNLQSQITQNASSITAEISRATSAENALSTKITQTATEIRSEVSQTYSTKTELGAVSDNLQDLAEDIQNNYSTTKDVQSLVSQTADTIRSEVSSTYVTSQTLNNYSTTEEMNSAIQQKADSITSTISSTYATKTYADSVANTALTNAKADTDKKLESYSTTTEMNSAISQKADEITSSVSKSYATKSEVETVDGKFSSYSTTTEMNSAINQKADELTTTISKTYTTKEEFNALEVGGTNLLVRSTTVPTYLSTSGGTLSNSSATHNSSATGDITSDWIDVSAYDSVVITLYDTFTDTVHTGRYCLYNSSKTVLSTTSYNPRSPQSIIVDTSSASYMRITAISCLTYRYKIEKGNKATDWSPAPEDVESEITSVETIATQTAEKFQWIVKSGTSASNFTLTDRMATLTAEIISLNGNVQISGDMLVDGAVTADKLSVDTLSAISADLGKVTAGSISITYTDETNPFMKLISPNGELNLYPNKVYLHSGSVNAVLSDSLTISYGNSTSEGIYGYDSISLRSGANTVTIDASTRSVDALTFTGTSAKATADANGIDIRTYVKSISQSNGVFTFSNGTANTLATISASTLSVLPLSGGSITGDLTVSGQLTASGSIVSTTINADKIQLCRKNGINYGRISYYDAAFYTWYDYMSNPVVGACPTGGTPSIYGDVTSWAKRTLIESTSGYGWIWEATKNSRVTSTSETPTPIMSLSSATGKLTVKGTVVAPTFNGKLIGNATTATKATQDGNGNVITSTYLPLSGGTLTGVLNTPSNLYTDAYDGAINLNNSNIYGVNSIYTSDVAEGASEGFHFYRDETHVDTLWGASGNLYYVPNRTLGISTTESNSFTLLHSGNYGKYALPVAGGTMTGAINFKNCTWNSVGDDVAIGDYNKAGVLGIKGLNGKTGIGFVPYSGSVTQTIISDEAGTLTTNGNLTATGSLTATNLIGILRNSSGSSYGVQVSSSGDFIPVGTTYLGNGSNHWTNAYINNIYLGTVGKNLMAKGTLTISNGSGTLTYYRIGNLVIITGTVNSSSWTSGSNVIVSSLPTDIVPSSNQSCSIMTSAYSTDASSATANVTTSGTLEIYQYKGVTPTWANINISYIIDLI